MAARNKRTDRPRSSQGETRDSFSLHSRVSQLRDHLLEEARELQAVGKIREARAVEKRAGQAEQLAGALETEVRGASPEPDTLGN